MDTRFKQGMLALIFASSLAALAAPAAAQEWPMTQGDLWEVTGVHLKDGGALAYTKFLANDWKANQEFAKSKGWIKDYRVFNNVHARKGEPDLYLVTVSERMPSGPEGEQRAAEFLAWKKKTQADMQKEAGDRLAIRDIGSNMLLQEAKFR